MVKKNVLSLNIIVALIVLLGVGLATTDPARPPGGNETNLATGRGSTFYGRSLSNVLVVTTTVWMLNGVHGHTTHLRPAVPLYLVLVVGTACLKDRLIDTATPCYNA